MAGWLGCVALRTMVESSRVSRVSEGEMYKRFQTWRARERGGAQPDPPPRGGEGSAPRGVGESCEKAEPLILDPKRKMPVPTPDLA
jgi:hypothetical protein